MMNSYAAKATDSELRVGDHAVLIGVEVALVDETADALGGFGPRRGQLADAVAVSVAELR